MCVDGKSVLVEEKTGQQNADFVESSGMMAIRFMRSR